MDRPPARPWPPELLALIVGVAALNAFGITWGLPNATGDWAIDSIAPLGPLAYAKQLLYGGHWWSKYPPLQFTLLSIVYAPYAAFLAATGALEVGGAASYPHGLASPAVSVTLFTLMARTVSALMGVGVAVAAYRIGVELHGRVAGLLGSVLFACSPLAVYYADAANLEMPYLFWSSLAFLCLVRIARGASRATYVQLGVFAAAAVATKDQAYGLFLLLPIPLLAFHPAGARDRRVVSGAIAAVVTYLMAANVLLDFRGWLAHVFYITHDGSRPYQMYPATLSGYAALAGHTGRLVIEAATPPVVVLAVIGILAGQSHARRGIRLLGFAALSYLVLFLGPILYVFPRFVLPVVFVIAILAGVGGAALWRRGGTVGRLGVVGAFTCVFAYGTSMNLGLIWDSRYAAEGWLAEHVPSGTLVGTNGESVYLPRLPADLRRVPVEITPSGLRFQGDLPEYLVLSDAYYARYLRRAETRPAFLALIGGDGGYECVATFFRDYLPATSLIPTMNPRIIVLRHRGVPGGTRGGRDAARSLVRSEVGSSVPDPVDDSSEQSAYERGCRGR